MCHAKYSSHLLKPEALKSLQQVANHTKLDFRYHSHSQNYLFFFGKAQTHSKSSWAGKKWLATRKIIFLATYYPMSALPQPLLEDSVTAST